MTDTRAVTFFSAAVDTVPGAALILPLWPSGGPRAMLSPRSAGPMTYEPARGNPVRDAWLSSQGCKHGRVLAVTLAHSRRVVAARSADQLAGVEADGIVTDNPSVCAVVTVADCMPIYLYDTWSGAFGLLHSGWKGTGILEDAVELMGRTYGTRPADLAACLGPHIGPCCYRVDAGRAKAFSDQFGQAAVLWHDDGPRLNLAAANVALAERLGIGYLSVATDCTSCDPIFGSFRREGPQAFTRMAAVIGYPEHAS
ncbi:MAG: polyphenol oxidase family protein [Spirochaetales bacterium]|nr:polyphenol oxidase family protein [Spirochaetales bacterium]